MNKPRNQKLHLIATCSNKKKLGIPQKCQLKSVEGKSVDDVAAQWHANLSDPGLPKIPASDLYCGDMWLATLRARETARAQGFDTQLWILSAGWGFISAETPIGPYAATFSSAFADSVAKLPWPAELSTKERYREWWRLINERPCSQKFSMLDLLSADPSAVFLFMVSREYCLAIEQDILELITKGARVIILSSGLYSDHSSLSPLVHDHILPTNEKFKQIDPPNLNKTNTSLNINLANWLISTFPDQIARDLPDLFSRIDELEKSLEKVEKRPPVKMTDDEVLKFIATHQSFELNSATRMLRFLRLECNLSCEQKRFGRLFAKAVNDKQRQGVLV